MSLKQIETEILWNEHVLKQSRDPKQKARITERLERLRAALEEAKQKEAAQ